MDNVNVPDYFTGPEGHGEAREFLETAKTKSGKRGKGRPKKDGGNGRRQRPERAKTDDDFLVDEVNPHHTLERMRKKLADHPAVYRRAGKLVTIREGESGGSVAHEITPDALVVLIHEIARPYGHRQSWGEVEAYDRSFPARLCKMFLDNKKFDGIKKLTGISSAPLIFPNGEIVAVNGYNPQTGIFLENQIAIALETINSIEEAAVKLQIIREHIASFSFADSPVVLDKNGNSRVDTASPPGADETAALAAIFTAVARSSLDIAPGTMVTAPPTSGSGAGKGLFCHVTSYIAHGRKFNPMTAAPSGDNSETEKRLASNLMDGDAVLFMDNINGVALKSDMLASATTENPIKIRPLGSSKTVPIEAKPFVVVAGNGLSPSEDMVRRFLYVSLDPRCVDAERRKFDGDILANTIERRAELLCCVLSIIQWGLKTSIGQAKPFGAYRQWRRMVSDVLVALGCTDMADRVAEMKKSDPHRLRKIEAFAVWWKHHGDAPMKLSELDEQVKQALVPGYNSRNHLQGWFTKNCVNVRVIGYHMTVAEKRDDTLYYRLEKVCATVETRTEEYAPRVNELTDIEL
jgi:hypothetical protein